MTWLNTVVILAIVVVVALEAWRKTGKALFDTAGVLLSVHIAHASQPGLASMVKFALDPHRNEAWAFGAVFLLMTALTVVASTYLYRVTLLALPDAFEGFAGAVLGLVSGLVVAHAIAWAAYTAGGGPAGGNPYATTVAVRELVKWNGYQQAMESLRRLVE